MDKLVISQNSLMVPRLCGGRHNVDLIYATKVLEGMGIPPYAWEAYQHCDDEMQTIISANLRCAAEQIAELLKLIEEVK